LDLEKYRNVPLSFSGDEVTESLIGSIFKYFERINLNPYEQAEWKKGIFKLFGVKTLNLPDLNSQNFIFASNHISDFDAVFLGLLHPKIKIVSKSGWANNKDLMDFLKIHYDIEGIYRASEIEKLTGDEKKNASAHNFKLFKNLTKYLKNTEENHHLLIFPQGTISDINKNSTARVNPGFAKMAFATGTGIVNMFTEYPEIGGITRVVCGQPYFVTNKTLDYSKEWLDDVISLQNQLEDVRTPVLSEKHSLNNNPEEPFF